MTTTKLVCIVWATVALAGCAAKPPVASGGSAGTRSFVTTQKDCPDSFTKGPLNACQGPQCLTAVNVVWDGNACQLVVGAQTIQMDKTNRGAFLSWWLPTGSTWEFREESSRFALPINFTDQNAPGLRDQFSQRMVVGNGRRVMIKNENTNGRKYEYQLRVFKVGGGPNDFIDSLDPAIQNDF